jgi:hypothetical protein
MVAAFVRTGKSVWPCCPAGAGDNYGRWVTHVRAAGSDRMAAQRPLSNSDTVPEWCGQLWTSLGAHTGKAFHRWARPN